MPDLKVIIGDILEWLSGFASSNLNELHLSLQSQFGQQAVTIIYISLAVIALAIAFKVFKIGLNLLRFVLIPTVVIAYIAATFFSLSFTKTLPLAGAACSALFLMKS